MTQGWRKKKLEVAGQVALAPELLPWPEAAASYASREARRAPIPAAHDTQWNETSSEDGCPRAAARTGRADGVMAPVAPTVESPCSRGGAIAFS
jgi:hypothetical protein